MVRRNLDSQAAYAFAWGNLGHYFHENSLRSSNFDVCLGLDWHNRTGGVSARSCSTQYRYCTTPRRGCNRDPSDDCASCNRFCSRWYIRPRRSCSDDRGWNIAVPRISVSEVFWKFGFSRYCSFISVDWIARNQ